MSKIKDGMRVRIKAREATAEEARNGQYAPYLGHATGIVMKVYNSKQIAINLDLDSLHADVIMRHKKQQEAMHKRWLDSLSEEARSRLTPEEKAFRLNYVVLLPESDLLTGKSVETPAEKQPSTAAKKPEPVKATVAPVKQEPKSTKKTATGKNVQAVVNMHSVKQANEPDKKVAAKPEKSSPKPEKSSAKPPAVKSTTAKQTAAPKTTKPEPAKAKPVTGKPKSTPQAQGRNARATKPEARNPKSAVPSAPKRPTSADLDAIEEQYLKSKKKRS